MAKKEFDKAALICAWLKDHFPLAKVKNKGPGVDTIVWILVTEGNRQAEIDLDRRSRQPPIKTTDWFFSHSLKPIPDEPRILLTAQIHELDYFDKLRKALEVGGLTYRERQT